jgi:hypothetical protein
MATLVQKAKRQFGAIALIGISASAFSSLGPAQPPQYHLIQSIVTDSGQNGFPTIDVTRRRLYGVGDKVIDIDSGRTIGTLHNSEHGFVLAPDIGRGVGMDGVIFDLSTLSPVGHIDADAYTSAYDSATGRAFLFRRVVLAVDVRQGRVLDSIDLGADPQSAVSDGHGHVYVNLGLRDSIAVIDARNLRVIERWPLDPCHGAGGLSIDRLRRRLFVSCQRVLAVVNADNGSIVARIPIAHGAISNAFDPTTRLIFNPNGFLADSTISVIREDSPDVYHVVERIPTGPKGSRLAAVDPLTHRIYLIAVTHANDEVLVFAPNATYGP